MNSRKAIFVLTGFFLISWCGLQAQTEKKKFSSLFENMHKEQLKVAKAQKFTKAEVIAVDRAMLATGKNITKILEKAPGETHQYLIDEINKEFRLLNSALGRALSGDKLTAFKEVTDDQKSAIIKQLNTNFVGSSEAIRTNIRAGLRAGIRASLIRGFGGEEGGAEFGGR